MHALRGKLLVLSGNFHQKSDNLPSWSHKVKGSDKKHACWWTFSKSILQLGNVELQSKTDGTDPEGIVEEAKIKLK
jgi:hypothetical protein